MSDDLIERLRDFTEEDDAYAEPWAFGRIVAQAADMLEALTAQETQNDRT